MFSGSKSGVLAGVSALMLAACAVPALAGPAFQYVITGSTAVVGTDPSISAGVFAVDFPGSGQGTAGGLQLGANDPAILQLRDELFSDPSFSNPLLYSNLGSFSSFMIVNDIDSTETALPPRFAVAAKPNTIEGLAWSAVFSGFLAAEPTFDLARFIQAIDDGPDINGGSGNNPDFETASNAIYGDSRFDGNIGTNFQAAQTLDLIVFTSSTGAEPVGVKFGTLTVNANIVPEPTTGAVLMGGGAVGLLRRRRSR